MLETEELNDKGGGGRTRICNVHCALCIVHCARAAVTHLVSFEPNLSLLSRIPNFPLVEKERL